KEERDDELETLHHLVGVAQPLPLEVQPPHPDLRRIRRAPLQLLSVLLAIDVRHQPIFCELGERAARLELPLARRWRSFVDRREISGANGLEDERRQAKNQRAKA